MLLHAYLIGHIHLNWNLYNPNEDITHYNNKDSTFLISFIYIDQLCNQHNKRD